MKKCLASAVFLLAGTVSVFAFAHDKHVHDKHVHGEAEMNVALDGNELSIEIRGPVASFLGFEHAPKNEKQKKALMDTISGLQQGGVLFVPNPEASCSFVSENVVVKQGKNSVQPAMLHTLKGHADMMASYSYTCEKPHNLKSITLRIFDRFKALQAVEVQAVLPKQQVAAELTAKNPILSW